MAASSESAAVMANRHDVTKQTCAKWKNTRTMHRVQTQLTAAQEIVEVLLRRTLLPPLDDLLAMTKEFICPQRLSLWAGPVPRAAMALVI